MRAGCSTLHVAPSRSLLPPGRVRHTLSCMWQPAGGPCSSWACRRRCRWCRLAPSRCLARPPALPQGSTARRDLLLSLQNDAQSKWEAAKAFDIDAPAQGSGTPAEKFFGTFPYPYMNGVLHLGHAFSLSKLEFASAYHRLCGKNVLFAQGFHCTGMPIKVRWGGAGRGQAGSTLCAVVKPTRTGAMGGCCMWIPVHNSQCSEWHARQQCNALSLPPHALQACADKLTREIATYGNPPKFPTEEEAAAEAPQVTAVLRFWPLLFHTMLHRRRCCTAAARRAGAGSAQARSFQGNAWCRA